MLAAFLYKKMKNKIIRYIRERNPRNRRGGLKRDKQVVFKDKMTKKGKWGLYDYVFKLWNEMSSYIKRVIKKYLENPKDLCSELKRLVVEWVDSGNSLFKLKRIYKSRENEVEKYVKGLFWILLIAENWKFIVENTVAK